MKSLPDPIPTLVSETHFLLGELYVSQAKFILERPFAGVACSANAAVEYFVSVFNVAGVCLGTKGADSIMNMAAMKLLCLVVLMGCCGQGQANINY